MQHGDGDGELIVRGESAEEIRDQLDEALKGGRGPKIMRFLLAIISGAIPYAGGILSAAGGAWSENEQDHVNDLFQKWMALQQDELREIGVTLMEVVQRLDLHDETVRERVESREYLSLVKKAFRDWSGAESEEKRRLIRNLLSNAAATKLTSDDVVRIFLDWIDSYSEPHFAVIRTVYQNPGCSRGDIWSQIHGDQVREDSAEADLFKLLIRDLSTGGVIRQRRETDYYGNFSKERRNGHRRTGSGVMMSAFDDTKPYVLTALGEQFIHYTMNEIVPKIAAAS